MKASFANLFSFLRRKTPIKMNIVKGDITQLGYQCVVNAANKDLIRGGGVCGSIYRAAGELLEWETNMLDPIRPGQAVLTLGYEMSEYCIHAVGPIYDENIMLEYQNAVLTNAYENSLDLASVNKISQIAFPLISTGIYGYPRKEAIKVALEAIKKFIKNNPTSSIEQIDIVCFSEDDYNLVLEVQALLK